MRFILPFSILILPLNPNVDLKPEIAKTKELAVTVHGQYGFISGSIF